MIQRPPRSTRPYTPFPDTTLFRSARGGEPREPAEPAARPHLAKPTGDGVPVAAQAVTEMGRGVGDHRARLLKPAFAKWKRGCGGAVRRPILPPRSAWLSRPAARADRSEEHTSELQSLMRISYAVFCLKKKKKKDKNKS